MSLQMQHTQAYWVTKQRAICVIISIWRPQTLYWRSAVTLTHLTSAPFLFHRCIKGAWIPLWSCCFRKVAYCKILGIWDILLWGTVAKDPIQIFLTAFGEGCRLNVCHRLHVLILRETRTLHRNVVRPRKRTKRILTERPVLPKSMSLVQRPIGSISHNHNH